VVLAGASVYVGFYEGMCVMFRFGEGGMGLA
jgi:hypothetical protein